MHVLEAIRFLIYHTTRFISPPPVALEWMIAGIAGLGILLTPARACRPLGELRHALHRLASSTRGAILVCGLLPVVVRLSMLGFAPAPSPSIHDEFSHLLLGDTLAHGQLTNATHPMWMHFETIHVIQQPTYNSMYPPAPASVLALGIVLFRQPWAGVVLSVGLMCAAICWMMQGWLPRAWALFGTLIVILKIGIVGFWMNSYLSGAVPAIGGALLIGALPRLRRMDSRPLHAVLAAGGVVILMNSRPFEGAVLSLAALVYLYHPLRRRFQKSGGHVLRMVVLPTALLLAAGIAFTAYYCWRVTGSPVRMPYQVNRDTYGWPENLAFLPAKAVQVRHKVMRDMYTKEVQHHDIYKTPERLLDNLITRLFDNWTFFFGGVLTGPLLLLPLVWLDRRTQPLVLFLGVIVGLNLAQMVLYPYHLGPVVPIMFAIVTQGIRHLYVSISRISRLRGLALAAAFPLCLILVGAMKQEADDLNLPMAYWERAYEPHRGARAGIEEWLEARPGPQLVIVRYSSWHSPDQEWVYNRADIDHSKVVWAREMGGATDRKLREYFRDRETWLLKADVFPPHVVRYGRPAPKGCPCTDDEVPE
jgi:hypothetical protein